MLKRICEKIADAVLDALIYVLAQCTVMFVIVYCWVGDLLTPKNQREDHQ